MEMSAEATVLSPKGALGQLLKRGTQRGCRPPSKAGFWDAKNAGEIPSEQIHQYFSVTSSLGPVAFCTGLTLLRALCVLSCVTAVILCRRKMLQSTKELEKG